MGSVIFAANSGNAVLITVFAIGAFAASVANYFVDKLGWVPRYRSAWRRFPRELSSFEKEISWSAKLPIVGPIILRHVSRKLRRDKRVHLLPVGWESPCFWLRPFLTELIFALFLSWRFIMLSAEGGFVGAFAPWGIELVFFWLLLCASLVDLDDYVIPDSFTSPGAVLGILGAFFFTSATPLTPTFLPLSLEPGDTTQSARAFIVRLLEVRGGGDSLATTRALFIFFCLIWSFWSAALLDRRFYPRLGIKKATLIFWRRIARSSLTRVVGFVWILGLAFFFYALKTGDSGNSLTSVDYLFNSLLGLFVGVVLIWGVRIVGRVALGVEAMGFGDVILTGMIGAYIGWQGVLIVFFLAPFFGLFFGFIRHFFSSGPQIPYGPFLALATVVYVVFRDEFSESLASWFEDPIFILGIGAFGFVALTLALFTLRCVKAFFRREAN